MVVGLALVGLTQLLGLLEITSSGGCCLQKKTEKRRGRRKEAWRGKTEEMGREGQRRNSWQLLLLEQKERR